MYVHMYIRTSRKSLYKKKNFFPFNFHFRFSFSSASSSPFRKLFLLVCLCMPQFWFWSEPLASVALALAVRCWLFWGINFWDSCDSNSIVWNFVCVKHSFDNYNLMLSDDVRSSSLMKLMILCWCVSDTWLWFNDKAHYAVICIRGEISIWLYY